MAALGEPTRLALVALLADGGEHCICELMPKTGATQSRLSRHMSTLKQAGLVSARRDRQWVRFRLDPEMPRAIRAIVTAALAALETEHDEVAA